MIKQVEIFLKQLVFLADVAVLVGAFLLTYFFRQRIHIVYQVDLVAGQQVLSSLVGMDDYLWLLLIILPLWTSIIHIMGGYTELRVKSYLEIIWILIKASLFALLFFGSVVFLWKLTYVSRSFMVFFFIISFSFLALERAALIYFWHLMSSRSYFRRGVLMVGTGPRAKAFIKTLDERSRVWGVRLVGILDQDPEMVGKEVLGYKIIGVLDDLPRLLRKRIVDEVVFVIPRNWMTRIEKSILYCESVGVRTTIVADLFNIRFAKAHLSDMDGVPAISFDPTPEDQWQLAIKRFMDILLSGLGLLVLSPLFVAVSLAIKATSPGPIFFRQRRCGLNGRRFTLFKFRSMVADAQARKAELEHLNEMKGPVFKLTNDPRLTSIGKWIRKTSIDELPQLINVFFGEMSLIGPRPPLPREVAQYEPWQRRRLSMRPGITGMWQVIGRNQITDFNVWSRLDIRYIDRWSLFLDFKIFIQTIPTVLFGIGAK